MKKITTTLALIGLASAALASVQETYVETSATSNVIDTNSIATVLGGGASVIYSNGPVFNSSGTGIGGDDESLLENVALGMTALGFAHADTQSFRVADDFEVTGGSWDIESIDFYAYQTGATASTITGVNLRIWDGVPGDSGSNVVFGDDTTNRMSSTGYSGVLRVVDGSSGADNNRQIAVSNVAVGVTLLPGTYWLDWQSSGSSGSGPWAPPLSILGQTTTGNGLQSADSGVTYTPLTDAGTATLQGLPFVMYGTLPPPPVVPTLSFYGLLLMGLIALLFGRRYIRQ